MFNIDNVYIQYCIVYTYMHYLRLSLHSWCGGRNPGGGPPLTGGGSSGSGSVCKEKDGRGWSISPQGRRQSP